MKKILRTQIPEDEGKSKNSFLSRVNKSMRRKKDKGVTNERGIVVTQEETVDEKADSDYAKSVDSENNRMSIISINNRYSVARDIDVLVQELEKVDKVKEELARHNQNLISELELSKQAVEKLQKDVPITPPPDKESYDQKTDPENCTQDDDDVQEVEMLKMELQQKDGAIQELNSQLATTKDEIEKVKKEVSERIVSQVELEASQEELKRLKFELQEQKDTVEKITSELETSRLETERVKKETLEQSQRSANSEIEKTRVALEVNKHEILNLKATLEQRDSELAATKKELEKVKKEAAEQRKNKSNSAQNEIMRIQIALNGSKEEVNKLKAEVEKSKEEANKSNAEVEKSREETKKLGAEVEKCQEEINKLKAEINKNQVALRKTTEKNAELNAAIEEKQNSLILIEEKNARTRAELEKIQLSLQSKTKEIETLESSFKSSTEEKNKVIEELKAELERKRKETEFTKKTLSERHHIDQSMEKELQMNRTEIQQLKIALQNSNVKINEQRNSAILELNNIKFELEQKNSILKNLESQLMIRDQSIQQQVGMNDSLNRALEYTKAELSSRKSELESTRAEFSLMSSELESTKAELSSTKSELENSSVEELKLQISNLRAELKANEWEKSRSISELKHQIESRDEDATVLREELEKMKKKVHTTEKLNEGLNIQLSEARKAREKAESNAHQANGRQSTKAKQKVNVVPINPVLTRDDKPTSEKSPTAEESSSKRNCIVEPTQTRGVETTPQANTPEPEVHTNRITSQTKKNGEDGWITVQKRKARSRNSMVIA